MKVGNKVNVSPNKYVKEILQRYQQNHGDINKEVFPLKLKEHPELDKSPFIEEKGHKEFQHITGFCQMFDIGR